MRTLRSIVCIMLFAALRATAADVAATPAPVVAKFGTSNAIYVARCIDKITASTARISPVVKKGAGRDELLFTPAADDDPEVSITFSIGDPPTAPGGACTATFDQKLTVVVDKLPTVPAAALDEAFRILMAAFVLALLMESAFALLFNWRLFQEYFVGRAWRTPIMFLISLAVVNQFGLDLLASLFNAYHGNSVNVPGGPVTQVLTAMIISGGSVG